MENKISPFLIVSYYTLNTGYVEACHKYLMSSISKLGIKSDIHGVGNLGSWQKNTSYKSKFIQQILEKHSENIVFLDADAEINSYPCLFENIPDEYLVGCHILDRNEWYNKEFGESRYELLSGTLFLKNCEETKELINKWVLRCEAYPSVWEQKILYDILKENNTKIYNLPLSYCYIISMPNGSEPFIKCKEPVITHNQVSRKLKNLVR